MDLFSNHGKKEGKVIKILVRNLNNIVGEITFRKNKLLFIPDDPKLDLDIALTKESTQKCVDGHKVLVEIIKKITEWSQYRIYNPEDRFKFNNFL